uniref:Uncharacterized protein n=1 Tax=Meloidogyne hapla TaxID=6305 RepID=A0A1I8B583_MELHA
MAAALASAQHQQQKISQNVDSTRLPPNHSNNEHLSVDKNNKGGINLLNILNMLNRKPFNNDNCHLKSINCEDKKEEYKQEFNNSFSPNKILEHKIKQEESETINIINQKHQQCSTTRVHSVEHLLGTNNAEESQKTLNKINEKLNEQTCSSNEKITPASVNIERLMLSLGTSFSRSELIRLLENPFMFSWTMERINTILDKQLLLVRDRVCENLQNTTSTTGFALIAEFSCVHCWNVHINDEEQCQTKFDSFCDSDSVDNDEFVNNKIRCTLFASFCKDGIQNSLLLGIQQINETIDAVNNFIENVFACLNVSPSVFPTPTFLFIRPQHIAIRLKQKQEQQCSSSFNFTILANTTNNNCNCDIPTISEILFRNGRKCLVDNKDEEEEKWMERSVIILYNSNKLNI